LAKKRTTEHMVEIHEYYVIKSVSGSLPALCTECATNDAVMISPEQARSLGASGSQITRTNNECTNENR
jgi:hypothetical protein